MRRALEPNSGFDFWHVLQCNRQQLREWIESKLGRGMTWRNYGTTWQMEAVVEVEVQSLDDFYTKFIYRNYVPTRITGPARTVIRKKGGAHVR